MGFVRTPAEIAEIERVLSNPRFVNARTLTVEFLTTPEVVATVLPPGLDPLEEPVVMVTVGTWDSNCVGTFSGGAVYVGARHGDISGAYTLAMFMDTDSALIFGRDLFGEPKKQASSGLHRDGERFEAWVERHEARLIDIQARMSGPASPVRVARARFNVKATPAADGHGLEDDAVLTVAHFDIDASVAEGEASLTLAGTIHDPLDELEIVEIRRATYLEGDMDTRCEALARIPAADFVGHAYGRLDYWPALGNEGAPGES